MDVETMKRLKTALAGRASVDIGHFQWINLDMVRAEAAEQWDSLRDKIYGAAAHFIEKRLGPNDVMVRCQGGFILIFADYAGADAVAHTEAISQELNCFFLGDRILQRLEISSKSQTVSMAELADMVASGAAEDSQAAAGARRKPVRKDTKTSKSVGHWQALKHEKTAGTAVSSSTGQWRGDLAGLDGDAPDDSILALSGADPADFDVAAKRWSHSTADLFSDLDKTWDDIVFMPSWDVRFGYITANFCLARRKYHGRMLFGRDTLLGNAAPDLHRLLDHSVAIAAQRGFMRRYAEGMKCAIAIPVNYDTIIGPSDRVRYFSILQCMPQKVRKYFYLRVDNIPDGAPQGQMEELFRAMRCFGSNILAKIPVGTIQLSRFENCGITLFSSELPAPDATGHIKEGVLRQLTAEAVSIERFGARGCLTNVATFEQLDAGLNAGFQVFIGDAVGEASTLPVPLQPCLLDDLRDRASDAA